MKAKNHTLLDLHLLILLNACYIRQSIKCGHLIGGEGTREPLKKGVLMSYFATLFLELSYRRIVFGFSSSIIETNNKFAAGHVWRDVGGEKGGVADAT